MYLFEMYTPVYGGLKDAVLAAGLRAGPKPDKHCLFTLNYC